MQTKNFLDANGDGQKYFSIKAAHEGGCPEIP
jgi:hypothetical protein